MRNLLLMTGLILLTLLLSACGPAYADVPPDEVEITPQSYGETDTSNAFEIEWKSYSLSITAFGEFPCMVNFSNIGDVMTADLRYYWLEPTDDCPPLVLSRLPRSFSNDLEVCVGMATAALEKNRESRVLSPGVSSALSLLTKRKFTVEDFSARGTLMLEWHHTYRGSERIVNFSYSDAEARFEVVADSVQVILTLQDDPSPYSAEVILKGGNLSAKALNKAGKGLPEEAEVLQFLRTVAARAHGLLATPYCGAPDDVVDAVRALHGALSSAEHFATYEELAEPLSPT